MKKIAKLSTFLGKDTEFDGSLKFNGTIRIDGHFKGEISGDGTLIVGEEGIIESDINVSHTDISGEIQGNIIADQKVQIRAPGKVFGNIQAPTVIIDEGVVFRGNCRMLQVKETDDVKLAAMALVQS